MNRPPRHCMGGNCQARSRCAAHTQTPWANCEDGNLCPKGKEAPYPSPYIPVATHLNRGSRVMREPEQNPTAAPAA